MDRDGAEKSAPFFVFFRRVSPAAPVDWEGVGK
jgi:hypothetical protein